MFRQFDIYLLSIMLSCIIKQFSTESKNYFKVPVAISICPVLCAFENVLLDSVEGHFGILVFRIAQC